MPELPEVETTLRGVSPALLGRTISEVRVHNAALRWPVTDEVQQSCGQLINRLQRRGKYLLIVLDTGGLVIHLGMSGSLSICDEGKQLRKHDHVDIILDNGCCLRFNDPRRFGLFCWWNPPLDQYPLLRHLGPEPLLDGFSGGYLYRLSRGRRRAVKNFIMDGKVVVGVGNIYASESLFIAGIHPARAAGRISAARYQALVAAIRDVLERAISQGGTTLRDFTGSDGKPGYFAQELLVYDRANKPCFQCATPIRKKLLGQRSSFYCTKCQV